MALGALRGTVFKSVLKDGLKLTLAGLVLGIGMAYLFGRGMSSLLFGVKSFDPATLAGAAFAVIATSIAALIVPARRALRVDPVVALHDEYSIFGIGVDRKHTLKWLFPQEKATLYGFQKVYVHSESALVPTPSDG